MMKIAHSLLLFSALSSLQVSAFTRVVHNNQHWQRPSILTTTTSHLNALPTIENVSTDDFMKQLGHASQLIPLLHPQEDNNNGESDTQSISDDMLQDILSAQLSSSDGIRGFFAV